MVRLDNYSAWVSVDGNPLQEYETTTEGSVVTCWISSEVGKNFEVNWEFFGVDGYHTADVRLDGQFARSRSANGRNWKSSAAGVLVTQASERLFMFSRLELTDDDVYLTETNAQLGEIKVELHESLNICPTSFKNQSRFSEPGKVHERSKKAIGHQIGYVSWSTTTGIAHTPTGWVKKNDARLNTSPRFVVFVYWQPLSFVIVPSIF
ncbi:hypothetical protein VKT23_015838 [Stygiomarasmius scandens]|uniref:DUF7918 domain-containing protein n=1 Tax=Marasmiellus scandens TaxID=2682957 RepID=A0ABR1J159_9AGAR